MRPACPRPCRGAGAAAGPRGAGGAGRAGWKGWGLLPEPVSVWATFRPSAETPGREEGPRCSAAGLLVVPRDCGFESRPRHSLAAPSSLSPSPVWLWDCSDRVNGRGQGMLTEAFPSRSLGRSTRRCGGAEHGVWKQRESRGRDPSPDPEDCGGFPEALELKPRSSPVPGRAGGWLGKGNGRSPHGKVLWEEGHRAWGSEAVGTSVGTVRLVRWGAVHRSCRALWTGLELGVLRPAN